MPIYCVNKHAQSNGDHEVHDVTSAHGCLPVPWNRVDLGYHPSCTGAVAKAQRYYANVDGCRWCATLCHTS